MNARHKNAQLTTIAYNSCHKTENEMEWFIIDHVYYTERLLYEPNPTIASWVTRDESFGLLFMGTNHWSTNLPKCTHFKLTLKKETCFVHVLFVQIKKASFNFPPQ